MISGSGILGAIVMSLLLIAVVPLMIIVILKNIGIYRKLSQNQKRISYVVSFFLLFGIERFGFGLLRISPNAIGLLFLYLFFLLFGSFIFQSATDPVLKKARWSILGITLVVFVALHFFVKS